MLRLMITSRAAKSCYQTQKLALKSSTPLVLSQLQPNVTRQSTRRNFQSSITRCASVSNDDELPQKLQNSPDLMEKVHKFMQLLETKGVDIRSGKPPGLTQMAKLVMDGEVRDATTEGEREIYQ